MMDEELCILCEEGFNHENHAVNVKEKGMRTLVRLCKERLLDDLHRYKIVCSFSL